MGLSRIQSKKDGDWNPLKDPIATRNKLKT